MPPREKRALTQARGSSASSTAGARPLADALARALYVSAAGDAQLELTHGFHTYPARMHPLTARRALALLGDLRGRVVLDPFCGSGTVLVEAYCAGAHALGVDVSPVALLVANARCAVREPLDAVVARAREIAAVVLAEGRAARRGTGPRRRRLPDAVWRSFDPHVAAEIAALAHHIEAEREPVRTPLTAVLSSILVKVSRRESDTAAGPAARRVARGAAARLLPLRAEERARGLRELLARAPRGTPPPATRLADARRLDGVATRSVAAIVTSPPYAGTYDYLDQQALRLALFDLDARALDAGELGARRHFAKGRAATALLEWESGMTAALREMARVLAPGGGIAMVIGDSLAGEGDDARAVLGDEATARLAARARLRVVASASQGRAPLGLAERRAFARRPKQEHLVYLEHA